MLIHEVELFRLIKIDKESKYVYHIRWSKTITISFYYHPGNVDPWIINWSKVRKYDNYSYLNREEEQKLLRLFENNPKTEYVIYPFGK